ncbi:MAG TPA: hypothetical protein VFX49_05100 [Chloroflexota bacterium]|nr:hypothetical protein [Chloroflexota bacterium]
MTREVARLALLLLLGLPLTAIVGLFVGGTLADVLGAAGFNLAVLALGALASTVAAHRGLPPRSRPLVPAFGVQGAHAVWLLTAVLLRRQWGGLIDVLAIAGPLIWLGARPERRPAAVLLIAHGIESLLLLFQWARDPDPGAQLPVLVSHLSLRLAGALLTVRALQTIWRRDRRPVPRLG